MSQILRTLLLLALFLVVPRVANACGCSNVATVLDDYERADLVIIARMKSVTKGTTPNRFGSDISHATMEVQKVFKGDVAGGQDLTFGQGEPVLDCSWQFYKEYVGEEYLLYLYRPEKPSEPFYVSTCNRSGSLEASTQDLLYLNNIDKVRGRTRVAGVIELEGGDDEDLADWQIRISGKNRSYIATTDKNGVYELYDLPPGRYSLEPVLKTGWKIDAYGLSREPTRAELTRSDSDLPGPNKVSLTLRAKRHFEVNIRLRLSNKITGVVTSFAGRPLHHVCVSLVPADDSRFAACNAFTKADGRFVIQTVRARSYYLLLNYQNVRSSNQPFPKLYYPGVTNAEAAKLFEVKFGESIEGLKFVVPNLDETITLQGIVRYSDGRPASNKWVGFTTPKTGDVDGSVHTRTDKEGRFSLTVLKGLRGELYSTYPPNDREIANCPQLRKSSKDHSQVFETERLNFEATENKTLTLTLPVSPCR